MLRALYSSATGMKAQETLMDVTANNLANVNTNGFKRSQVDFADLLYSTIRQAGTELATGQPTPIGLQIGSGVRPVGTTKNFSPGSIQQTGIDTDVAIEGDGFFKINVLDGGERYTRDGAFRPDNNGNLVTTDGYQLATPINIPQGASDVQVGADGTVTAVINGEAQQIGQIMLYRFINPAGLSSEGNNLYSATSASGAAEEGTPGSSGFGTLRGSFLEGSNVEVVTELISLITAQRAYEVNSRAIRAGDEMMSTTTDIIR